MFVRLSVVSDVSVDKDETRICITFLLWALVHNLKLLLCMCFDNFR